MKILYADDDKDDCELVVEALEAIDPKIKCTMASDGSHALQLLQRDTELPDYIFLDVNMPVMDGKHCLLELKKDKRLKNIPVVIYSTTQDKEEIHELYAMGADAFVRKPNNFTDLCVSLLEVLTKLQTSCVN
jgi:CheY-like chemotaxis protein